MNDEATIAAPPKTDTFKDVALGVARAVQERGQGGSMTRGERAELRRMREDVIPPEPFWKLVERHRIPRSQESFWRDIVPLMVDHPHRKGMQPGSALAAAGVSSARIERWLRLPDDRARREARRLLVRLGEGVDWGSLGPLLFYWSTQGRRAFARNYFLSPELRQRRKAASAENNS